MWDFISSFVSRNFIYGLIAAIAATVIGIFIHNYNETIRQAAIAEYNLKQAQQTVLDQQKYIEQMEAINKDRSKMVIELQKRKEYVDQKLIEIEKQLMNNPKAINKDASDLLKETIKALEDASK
jgi:ribosomal protein S8